MNNSAAYRSWNETPHYPIIDRFDGISIVRYSMPQSAADRIAALKAEIKELERSSLIELPGDQVEGGARAG